MDESKTIAENHTSHPARATGVVTLLAFTVMFAALIVFPGFVAAGFSREEKGIAVVNDFLWKSHDDSPSLLVRGELAILTPAIWSARRSKSVREFYMWQYRLAHGREYWVESD